MTHDEMWKAVINNDSSYDGVFFYAVKTTKIYCLPSCKSKTPLKTNVVFFNSVDDAENAGYRACKRCKSNMPKHMQKTDIAHILKSLINTYYNDKTELDNQINNLRLSKHRLTILFKQSYNITPKQYLDETRISKAKELLKMKDELIIDIAYDVGYQSLSAFNRKFQQIVGISPSQFRDKHNHG